MPIDPYLDSRNYGKVTKRQLEDVERLRYAKRTHQTHFMGIGMPWHDDTHRFGESGEEKKEKEPYETRSKPKRSRRSASSGGETFHIVDYGNCSVCGRPAVYANRGRLYCPECWIDLDDDPYEMDYGGHA